MMTALKDSPTSLTLTQVIAALQLLGIDIASPMEQIARTYLLYHIE